MWRKGKTVREEEIEREKEKEKYGGMEKETEIEKR
jgi:hypothetical protein